MDDSMNGSMSDTMERPAKRPRLSFTPDSPEEVPEEWDLQAARAQNDMRLKSIFERIFTKYGQDFTEVGDEIDLETGKVVVDNGHLLGMREENDTGDKQTWLEDCADSENEWHNAEEDEPAEPQATLKNTPQDDSWAESDTRYAVALDSAPAYTGSPNPGTRPGPKVQSTLKQVETHPGPTDPLWKAPELPPLFSTPTAESRTKVAFSPQLPNLHREPSPPGSGSLWSIPRRGRPRTDEKPKTTPSKRRPRAKRKHHSSPMARDWSFAQTPDGDESDDPLQAFQPSPTPSRVTSVRGKCKEIPPLPLNRHSEPTRQSSTPAEPFSLDQVATGPERKRDPDLENENEPEDDGQEVHLKRDDTPNNAAFDTILQCDTSAWTHAQAVNKPPEDHTPSKSQGGITPNEAKLIVCMRYVQKKGWTQICDALPGRTLRQLHQWNYFHWTDRRASPPKLSAPWSPADMETLEKLKDQPGLSWFETRAELPGRSRAEIEFELLRLWVGGDVWNCDDRSIFVPNEGTDHAEEQESDVPEPPSATPVKPPLVPDVPDIDPNTAGDRRSRGFEQFIDEVSEDSGSVISEASPSKLSIIFLDSPASSRQGSQGPSRASPAKRLKMTF